MHRHGVRFLAATTSLGLSLLGPSLMAQRPEAARSGVPGRLSANLLALVTHPAVQAELKLTDAQKRQLEALGEKDEELRRQWLERMGLGRPDGVRNRGDGHGQGGQAAQAGQPGDPLNGTGVGRGSGNLADADQQDPFATMLEARLAIQQATERSIARILSRAQYARAGQIQLQVEGTDALLRPDLRERLDLDLDQVAQIRELMQERRQALRETRDARNALREAALDRDPALGRAREKRVQNVQQVPNDINDRGRQDGGRNDPSYREARNQARRTFDEARENQKRMAAFRAQDEMIDRQFHAALHRIVLTRRQSQAYRKMLGAPFDPARSPGVAKAGPGGSAPGGNRGGMADAERPSSARGPRATTATSEKDAARQPRDQATAKPGRQSLRERRGLGPSDDQP